MPRRRVLGLLTIGLATIGALGAAEGLVRWSRPQLTYGQLRAGTFAAWHPSELNTYTLKPRYRGTDRSRERPGEPVTVTINAQGLRGPELRPAAQRVLILGDSYTFGQYLDDSETYPTQLQHHVDRHGLDTQVLNAGYAAGSAPDQYYVWLKANAPTLRPAITLVGFFLGNDIGGIDARAWRDPDERGLPTRYVSPEVYVGAEGRLRSKAPGVSTVGSEFFYRVPILRETHLFIAAGKVFDRFFLGHRAGFTDAAFAHIFGEFDAAFLEQEQRAVDLLAGMKAVSSANRSAFAVVLIPINFMVDETLLLRVMPGSPRAIRSDYYERFAALLAARGVESLNIGAAMRQSGGGPFFPSDGEVHFNPRGAAFTAEQIFMYLQSSGLTGAR